MSDDQSWHDNAKKGWKDSAPRAGSNPNWERDFIEKIALSGLQEQKRARRWGIFFKSLTFLYLFALFFMLIPQEGGEGLIKGARGEHTAIIEIKGVISDDAEASADRIITGLRNAYKNKNTKGIILRLNSPGGSPVQAGYVNDEIYRLRALHPDIPIIAVVMDICASGCYYIAAAADSIYVDKASMVGSIGVLMNGFGFVEGMKKLGIERRLLTAGAHKGLLDPFSPMKPEEKQHMLNMLEQVHQQFIEVVKKGRGPRLKESSDLFSGLIWSGEQAIELGLADEFGSSSQVAREVVKAEELVDYTVRKNPMDRFIRSIGSEFGAGTIGSLVSSATFQ
ncbi:MAG: S49 family peptidase [Gammaproteobacteria bacterium]|nr:MAG: S49 family peptidase [Gammaproteobacteria bacterium]